MSDPLDTLYRPEGFTEPDPEFRAALMIRLERALTHEWSDSSNDVPPQPELLEVVMKTTTHPDGARRRALAAIGLAAAAVAAVGFIITTHDDNSNSPVATTPTTTSTTTTVPALTDAEIAQAGLLTTAEVGDNYRRSNTVTFHLDRDTGPGADRLACASFLDTVFESPDRPATVRIQAFAFPGAQMQQYVVVFPDESGALAMMRSVADPTFPACMAAITTAMWSSAEFVPTPYQPFDPRPLAPVGDEMKVVAVRGTYSYHGADYDDEGLIPFVRVGRAVTWLNPSSAPTVYNTPGYPDSQLEKAITTAAEHLRAAQAG